MNIKQLHALRAVLAGGTVTNAALAMHLTQPAVSRLLLQLEAEIGFPLFDRRHGRLWITPEGETFCREASRAVAHLDHLVELARDLKRLQVGFLRIIALPSIAYGILPRAIARFSRLHPEVQVDVSVRQRKELEKAVAAEPFDVAFTSMPLASENIEVELLPAVRATCVLPQDHRLAGKPSLQAADFAGECFIAGVEGTVLRTRLDEIFAAEGVRRRQVIIAETTMMICELVAAGVGVSVVNPLLTGRYAGQLAVAEFGYDLSLRYGMILPDRRPRSQLAEVFTGIVRRSLEPRPTMAPGLGELCPFELPVACRS